LDDEISLELIYREVKKLGERIDFLEDLIEEIIIRDLPKKKLSMEDIRRIKESIEEMEKGEFVSIEELKSA